MLAKIRQFLAAASGNISLVFALSLAPLAAGVGGALDYTRTMTIGSEIQSALDAGVLAAASLSQGGDPETVVRAYVEAAIAEHDGVIENLVVTVDSTIALNARDVTADAVVSVPTLLLPVVGIDRLTMLRASQATEQIRNLEIALVLDVSGSMSGSKIEALRDAAAEFVNVMFDADPGGLTSLSIIPYNGGVRLPDLVNAQIVSGGSPERSGCPELGEDHPVSVALPANGLPWLEWRGQEQRDGHSSSFCPESDEASVFLQQERQPLLDLIDRLDAGGNTGLDVATAWGARALDPLWRGRLGGVFPERPVDYQSEGTLKVLVVMTDGAATAQRRTYQDSDGDWQTYSLYSSSQARTNMAAACDAAALEGVAIYTIAFQVSGSTNRDLMRNCASQSQNYFEVETMDIAAAFSAIAADLNSLRLAL